MSRQTNGEEMKESTKNEILKALQYSMIFFMGFFFGVIACFQDIHKKDKQLSEIKQKVRIDTVYYEYKKGLVK